VLFPVEKELDILLKAGGVSYAIQKLNRAGRKDPNEEDRRMAEYVLNRSDIRNKDIATTMADFAVQWGDTVMWTRVAKASGADKSVDVLGRDRFIGAWKAFSFEAVRPM
jgi:hypothetical protein